MSVLSNRSNGTGPGATGIGGDDAAPSPSGRRRPRVPGADADGWINNEAPTGRWPALALGQLWTHRELLYFFALRDVKVRYKQAFLGVAWAGVQPLIGALAFTVLFNRLADVDVGGRSYFAFALVGFAVWTYFSMSVTAGSRSLVDNAELLTKVSFPRVIAPAATLFPSLIDLAVGSALAVVVVLAVGDGLSVVGVAVGLPLGLLILLLATAAPTLFFSATVVRYRDAAALVGFGVQMLLFISPIAYPPDLVPGAWQTVLYVNPVSGALGALRSALTGAELPSAGHLGLSLGVALVLFIAGLVHFRRNEREFADII